MSKGFLVCPNNIKFKNAEEGRRIVPGSVISLGFGYELTAVDLEQFKREYAVYVVMQDNWAFKQDYQHMVDHLNGAGEVAGFILKDGIKIGGVIVAGQAFADPYLYPFYVGLEQELLELLTGYLSAQGHDEIIAQVSSSRHMRILENLGYRILHADRCMIRPTESFAEKAMEGFVLSAPVYDDIEEIGGLLFDDGNQPPRFPSLDAASEQSRQFFRMVEGNEICLKASSLSRCAKTGKLAGACLIAMYEGLPIVYEIAVRPAFRRRGLAKSILERGISVMSQSYPAIRLYVAESNQAKELYSKMGFMSIGQNSVMKLGCSGSL